MRSTETDVLIIGAGPAGASAALFLAKKGIRSILLDKSIFPRDKICGDALSGKVVEVLKRLDSNILKELDSDERFLGSWGVTFYSPNGEALRLPFSSERESHSAPGFICRRSNFDDFLVSKVRECEYIRLLENTEVRKFIREGNHYLALTKDNKTFKTKVIIACDGAYSTFSKRIAGITAEPNHNCYGLRSYYKNVQALDSENFIELHFLKKLLPGYFWIFPLPDGSANVGMGMRADVISKRKINLKKTFLEIINNHKDIKPRFSGAQMQGEVKLFGLPLGSKRRVISGDNFILCGDAAQLIDPFTGEGIGNAMLSGFFAAEQVERSLLKNDFRAGFMKQYDDELYSRLWSELILSYRLQQLTNFPWLFNLVVKKANSNPSLRKTISCMFEDIDLRSRLKNPRFYLDLLFSRQT